MSVSYTFREKTKRWTMGALAVFLPIVLYAIGIKYLFDRFYWGKSKIKKRVFFILLLTLPFWDHIAGYAYFKYLCFTQGGVKIYKTVTDLQEQKDYWFRSNISNGILGEKFYTKKDILVKNLKIPISKKLVFTSKNKTTGKYNLGYLNYCNNKYNNLTKNDKNYKYSCKNTKEIIKKYDLKNVIKVPKSDYVFYSPKLRKERYIKEHYVRSYFFKILPVGFGFTGIKNKNTNEILGEFMNITLNNGRYMKSLANLIGFKSSQRVSNYYGNRIKLKELVIPNPYK